ncbi:MAG: glutamine--fructose-6-phosphate transaminase (isomerizing) [Clostridiales bacterium]|nr:glutamine--fructose-6-phosphate transaminase (isomerizing) [Clostridiales bacterium]
MFRTHQRSDFRGGITVCGIFGYVGGKSAAKEIVQGLQALTYRGYDSAGVAVQNDYGTQIKKGVGAISEIAGVASLRGKVGVGHTRWATHGEVSVNNAHPFSYGGYTVVHNGIIENYAELKRELTAKGYVFQSQTDSEVIVMLLHFYREYPLLTALRKTVERLTGSYAIVALSDRDKGSIVCTRKNSPLIIGLGKEETFISSDVPALYGKAYQYTPLNEGDFVWVHMGGISFYHGETEVFPKLYSVNENASCHEKRGYAHFMRKEIGEVPNAVNNTLTLLRGQEIALKRVFSNATRVLLTGCGTAFHAAVFGKYLLSRALKIPTQAEVASELRYSGEKVEKSCVCIAITQSGETADTLRLLQSLKKQGHKKLIVITNTPRSSVTAFADITLLTGAGPEIGVAATKSFTSQLAAFTFIVQALSGERGEFITLPKLLTKTLQLESETKEIARELQGQKSVFFLGRDLDYPLALEGSLKLKEVSYLFSDGYAAGELKHGTLALIEKGTPVIVCLTQPRLAEKTLNALHEVSCRGAKVFLITQYEKYSGVLGVEKCLLLPPSSPHLAPLLLSVPLQFLAYHTAVLMGRNPDRPRNLAKSVTVE